MSCKAAFSALDPFLRPDLFQMLYCIRGRDPLKIEYLTTRQDRRQDLVLLRRCQDEDRIGRRLLQRFQKGIERRGAEHMHFIDDIYLVFACLRGKTHLFHQRPDIVDRVVAGGIQLMNIQRSPLIK